jgi:hypothetical protein
MSIHQQNQTNELQLQNGGGAISPELFRRLHDENHGRLLNSMIAVTRNREHAEDITAAARRRTRRCRPDGTRGHLLVS